MTAQCHAKFDDSGLPEETVIRLHRLIDQIVRANPKMLAIGVEFGRCEKCGKEFQVLFPIPTRFPEDCTECGSEKTVWLV
jgi:predicted Zn-ribbon and HTH transcriptional regulator